TAARRRRGAGPLPGWERSPMPDRRSSPSRAEPAEGFLVLLVPRSHGEGELQVGDRACPLPGLGARERQAEVCVVVDRIDLERLRELAAGGGGGGPAGERARARGARG